MISEIENTNLKVLIFDTDFYALMALNSYLAWDRRTRVTHLAETLDDMFAYLGDTPEAELPDVVLFDAAYIGGSNAVRDSIDRLLQIVPDVMILCTAPQAGPIGQVEMAVIEAAAEAGARGFLIKQEVRLQIAWAIVFSLDHQFVVTRTIKTLAHERFNQRLFNATMLPPQRDFPEMTERIRQAIALTVVEGMPAHLAAHEMGISLHTVRGYVKEGYRIMESHDHNIYPMDMTPQERAFMRFTGFDEINHADSDGIGGAE
jgi:DNA-binding NarL/FixJ family response regulator